MLPFTLKILDKHNERGEMEVGLYLGRGGGRPALPAGQRV